MEMSTTQEASDESESSKTDDQDESDNDALCEQKTFTRKNRGLRVAKLIGEEVDKDKDFWGHGTWEEEEDDNEWYTDDEGRYKDSSDSDIDDSEEAQSDEEVIVEEKNRKKENVYKDPSKTKRLRGNDFDDTSHSITKATKSMKTNTGSDKQWKTFKLENLGFTQSQMLDEAKETEEKNKRALHHLEEMEMTKQFVNKELKKTVKLWEVPHEVYITWASYLLLPNEIAKTEAESSTQEIKETDEQTNNQENDVKQAAHTEDKTYDNIEDENSARKFVGQEYITVSPFPSHWTSRNTTAMESTDPETYCREMLLFMNTPIQACYTSNESDTTVHSVSNIRQTRGNEDYQLLNAEFDDWENKKQLGMFFELETMFRESPFMFKI